MIMSEQISLHPTKSSVSRDSLVVRTLRCGRSNPGSNPGHGIVPLLRFALKRAHMEVEQRGVIKFQSLMCHHMM